MLPRARTLEVFPMMSSNVRNQTISAAWHRNLRRSPRARIDIVLKVWRHLDGEKHLVCGRTRDVSEHGIAAHIAADLEMNEKVEIQFTLPGSTTAITLQATVCAANERLYGFEFNSVDRLTTRTLGALVKM
jgi:hypothetical protein